MKLTPLFLPSSPVSSFYFVLAVRASIWENTRVRVHISYSHTECYLIFSDSSTTSAQLTCISSLLLSVLFQFLKS